MAPRTVPFPFALELAQERRRQKRYRLRRRTLAREYARYQEIQGGKPTGGFNSSSGTVAYLPDLFLA